jgi:3-oxoacyl-[acyl-carrier protein] reductase
MQIDLSGKNAVVTGGAAGIGEACARTLANAGARVAVLDINAEGARTVASSLPDGVAIPVDLGDEASVQAACAEAVSTLGGVDILINNAGIISYRKGVRAVSPDEWDQVLDVNLRGTFLMCRELIDSIKERGWGKVVNFSSLAARVGGIEVGIHYAASKAGLLGLTRTLAKEGAPHGITVNAVAPGVIATGPVIRQVGDHEDAYRQTIPMGRLGRPEDVARVVLFLASPLSDYVTGIVIDVNGGMYMG